MPYLGCTLIGSSEFFPLSWSRSTVIGLSRFFRWTLGGKLVALQRCAIDWPMADKRIARLTLSDEIADVVALLSIYRLKPI